MNDDTGPAGMQDLNDLFYFVQVVDHGGFAPAGRALGMPKSKLSRRIALLEERLGVRLIQRSTRKFVVTNLGRTYYGHARAALVEAAAAEEAIQRTRAEPRGIVRMSCPTTLLDVRVGPMLADFLRQHPQVELHLDATNHQVDVLGEGLGGPGRARTAAAAGRFRPRHAHPGDPQAVPWSPARRCWRGSAAPRRRPR